MPEVKKMPKTTPPGLPLTKPPERHVQMPGSGADSPPLVSVISSDLTIIGKDLKIISKGALQIDGEVQGEIEGVEVTVSSKGRVIGTVTGQKVVINGEVQGEIQGDWVTLQASSRVEGDVHHRSLIVESGARFDGRARHRPDEVRS